MAGSKEIRGGWPPGQYPSPGRAQVSSWIMQPAAGKGGRFPSPSLNQGPSNLIPGLPYWGKGLLASLPGKSRPGTLGAPLGGAYEG